VEKVVFDQGKKPEHAQKPKFQSMESQG